MATYTVKNYEMTREVTVEAATPRLAAVVGGGLLGMRRCHRKPATAERIGNGSTYILWSPASPGGGQHNMGRVRVW